MVNRIKTVVYDLDDTVYDFDTPHRTAIRLLGEAARERFGEKADEFMKVYSTAYDVLGCGKDPLAEEAARKRTAGGNRTAESKRNEECIHTEGCDAKAEKNQGMPQTVENSGLEEKVVGTCHSRTLRLEYALETMGLPLFPHVLELYDIYWGYILDHMEAKPYIHETMAELKRRGYRIGIGTNMTAKMQFQKLEKIDLGKYIDFMVTSEESVFDKPDQAFFDLVVKKAQCLPEECLFIGDNPMLDCKGAIAAGLHGFWYDPDRISKEEKSGAEDVDDAWILYDHRDILKLL